MWNPEVDQRIIHQKKEEKEEKTHKSLLIQMVTK